MIGEQGTMLQNVAQLLASVSERRPTARVGMVDDPLILSDAYGRAADLAFALLDAGVEPGRPGALVGSNTNEWFLAWMALQLAGVPSALLNPALPDSLIAQVVAPLKPQVIVCTDRREPIGGLSGDWMDLSGAPIGGTGKGSNRRTTEARDREMLPGFVSPELGLSAYMLTSGTSGVPKLVAQSHAYFLSLGRYVADVLSLTAADRVFTPLPLFHINPLGYALFGAFSAGADLIVAERFSASGFWPLVRSANVTVAVLHGPPVEILKRRTTREDAHGHQVRAVLYSDPDFLRRFEIPLGLSVYGSTEGGGLSATFTWRPWDSAVPPEGAVHYGGEARLGFTHTIASDGEILVRPAREGLLASGYIDPDGVICDVVSDGVFHSGDRGYLDDSEGIVFVSRQSESIRVKGEFVPIKFLEDTLRQVPGIHDLAVWKRPSALADEEIVLYVEADAIPLADLRAVCKTLPGFMRPSVVVRLPSLPRDSIVGKTRRRELSAATPVEVIDL